MDNVLTKRFGDLYLLPSSNGLSRPAAVRGSGFKMINMGELFANNIITALDMERVQMSETEQKKFFLEEGDLLFARQSLVAEGAGKCSIVKTLSEPTTFESHIIRVRLNKTLGNPWYYYYLFQMKSNPIKTIVNQCAQAGIRGSELIKIKVPNPSILIQQKIANILSRYDEAIENNNKRIKLLEQMAQNLYKEWFVRFRFPGYENCEFENGIPKGWKVERIGELYHTTSGGTPSRNHEEYYQEGTYPWIKTGELKDYPIIETEEYITEDAIIHSSAKVFEKDSLIIAMYGATIGHLGINKMPATCNQACCVLRPKENRAFGIYYLFNFFKGNRDFIIGLGNGAAQQNLSQILINKIKILNPPKEVLEPFEKMQSVFFEKIYFLQRANTNLAKQRDLLLPRLMSGKIEVK